MFGSSFFGFVGGSGGGIDPSVLARITYLEDNETKFVYFEEFSSTTGTVTVPTQGELMFDQFAGGVDAYVSTVESGQPTGVNPQTSGGVTVDVASFDALGNFTLTGTPSAYPIAIIYVFKIKAKYQQNVNLDNVVEYEQINFATVVYVDAATANNDYYQVASQLFLTGNN